MNDALADRLWRIQEQMDAVNQEALRLNRAYDESPDGSHRKQKVLTAMEANHRRRVGLEADADEVMKEMGVS